MEVKPGIGVAVLTAALLALAYAGGAAGVTLKSTRLTVTQIDTTSANTPPFGPQTGAAQPGDIDTSMMGGADDDGFDSDAAGGFGGINRTIAKGVGKASATRGNGKAKSNPEVVLGFEGLNFNQQRFANGGNQFSIEPPDQGLCVGNGYVMETVNSVIKIFDTSGNLLKGPIDQNTFYGYIAAINRSAPGLPRGPSIIDPSCFYDADTQRWFHVVLTLDHRGTSTAFTGNNHLDIAVSNTSDPTGAWTIYSLPTQNNGTQGTPDHQCNSGFCLSDYPHLGADANGLYITTNEFAFSGPGFYGVNIYAFDKHALARLSPSVNVELVFADVNLVPAFTVWPALSPGMQYDGSSGGTEFLMSSLALFTDNGVANQLLVWSLTNTKSLATPSPSLGVNIDVLDTLTYAIPPNATQKSGDTPLRSCLADMTIMPNCFAAIAGAGSRANNPLLSPEANDSRIQQVIYANGKLWTALDTGVLIDGDPTTRAGIAYFVLNPHSGHIFAQGLVGLSGNNLTYPAIAVTESGRGAMAFTVLGDDHYPSAGYASIDTKIGVGDVHIAAEGIGPTDGFAGYVPLGAPVFRPRWGDYGAAVADGNTIWIASEYTAQTCTYAAYLADPTCGGTRGALGNWSTRITRLSVH